MKKKVKLEQIKQRTKAFYDGKPVKTIPKPYIYLVSKLGFVDIRTDKQTLSPEERLLLVLYDQTEKYKDIPNFKGLENIEILSKNLVTMRDGDDYYSVNIKDGPEIKIKMSMWNKLNTEEKEIKRWV